MVWYKPSTWFKKDASISEEYVLLCDNPQCASPILDGIVAYNKEQMEFYHDSDCVIFANAHRAFKSERAFENIEYVKRDTAIELLNERK